jgi:hypothetical protein
VNLVFRAIGVLEEQKRCLALLEVPELRRHCRLMNRENLAIHVWQEGIKEMAERKIVRLALKDTSAPSHPQLQSNAAALLFTVLLRVPLSTLRRQDTTLPQLLPPTKRESANCLARLVSLAWEESSLSASRVLPSSPTLLKRPASPALRVLPEPTKAQPVAPQPTLSANLAGPEHFQMEAHRAVRRVLSARIVTLPDQLAARLVNLAQLQAILLILGPHLASPAPLARIRITAITA